MVKDQGIADHNGAAGEHHSIADRPVLSILTGRAL